jgi:hypothetical protein
MKYLLFLVGIAAVVAGCNAPSTMDRIKEAEARRSSRQLKQSEAETIKRLKAENRALRDRQIVEQKQIPAPPTEAAPQTTPDPNLVGVVSYKKPYTEPELKQMAASFALSQTQQLAPTIEYLESDPGIAIESQITSAKYNRTNYRYDPNRKKKVSRKAKLICGVPDVEIRWSDKDRLFWAKADVRLERTAVPPGTPSSIFKTVWMLQGDSGGWFVWKLWTPPSGWTYRP